VLGKLVRHLSGPRLQVAAHKTATLRSRIMPMPLPKYLILTLPPGLTVQVSPGDQVARNELLASSDSEFGRRLYAPTSGQIRSIDDQVCDSDAQSATSKLTLEVDFQHNGSDLPPIENHQTRHHHELLERIAQAGVVCTNPEQTGVAERLAGGETQSARVIIINAAESEPYLCADEALLREHAEQVVQGAEILQQAGQAARCVIAVQRGKTAALAALGDALSDSSIELNLLPAGDYPSGTDPQVIRTVTGREIGSGTVPDANGILVFTAGDAAAVCQAVTQGQMHTSRVVALAGAALRTPKCFAALFGTPIAHLLTLTGCLADRHAQTLVGGPLRGRAIGDLQTPVEATTTCIIAMTPEEIAAPPESRDCIRCGDCIGVCPANLQPQLLHDLNRKREDLPLLAHGMADCIQCGACSHVCPSGIDLASEFREARLRLNDRAQQQQLSEHWQQRFQFHQYRLKREREQAVDHFAAPATNPDSAAGNDFSRDQARTEIADAVARVRAKRQGTHKANDTGSSEQGEP